MGNAKTAKVPQGSVGQVITLPAPGKPKGPKIHWSGQDFKTFLEWSHGIRERTSRGMDIYQALEEVDAGIKADRLSKSGKGKTIKRG